MIVGYARTSTIDQTAGFEAQLRELALAGCGKLFQEQVSSLSERKQLNAAMDYVRENDIFVVTKLDRLARSVADLMTIIQALERKQVGVRILNLGMDTHTPTGKLMLTVLGAIAQFEREMMLERQREGIAKAKSDGRYKGRKPIDAQRRKSVFRLAAGRLHPGSHCSKARRRRGNRVSNSRFRKGPKPLTGLSVRLFQRPQIPDRRHSPTQKRSCPLG